MDNYEEQFEAKEPPTEFAITSSILSTTGITNFLIKQYQLSADSRSRLLKTGINHTYRIDSGSDTFIFRIYSFNWRTTEEINEELHLLNRLKQNGVAVSYPLSDILGNYIQNIRAPEGNRLAVMFSFAPGHKIHNYVPATHFEIGKLMAQFHSVTLNGHQNRISYTTEVLLTDPLDEIKNFLPEETVEMQFLRSTAPVLTKLLLEADQSQIRKGIVHLDIWFDNLNIEENNNITLFDFDFCGNGWLALDIAYYIMQLYNTEKDETKHEEKLKAFYNGYESLQQISSEEKRLIPILGVCLYYFYLGVQCKRFDNWSNTFLNEVYLKRFISVLIKGYYENATGMLQA